MSDFRRLSAEVWASPQIGVADLAEAARMGFAMVVNNRPDGEAEDQPEGSLIARAAAEAGLAYKAIPITPAGFGEAQIAEMCGAIDAAGGPVLAYCRSGTRSTLLWALGRSASRPRPRLHCASRRRRRLRRQTSAPGHGHPRRPRALLERFPAASAPHRHAGLDPASSFLPIT